jgi:hypothetical protein
MAIDTAQLAADLAAMIADMPSSCRYSGRVFDVSASEWKRSESLTLAGNIEEIDFRVDIPAFRLIGLPELKTNSRLEIKRAGETAYSNYRVTDIAKASDGIGIVATVAADRRN